MGSGGRQAQSAKRNHIHYGIDTLQRTHCISQSLDQLSWSDIRLLKPGHYE